MEVKNNRVQIVKTSLYQKVYGGTKISPSGPLFFLIAGVFCTTIYFIISLFGGAFSSGVLSPDSSGRPDVNFPIFNIIWIFLIFGAIIGLIFGISGLFWYYFSYWEPNPKDKYQRME